MGIFSAGIITSIVRRHVWVFPRADSILETKGWSPDGRRTGHPWTSKALSKVTFEGMDGGLGTCGRPRGCGAPAPASAMDMSRYSPEQWSFLEFQGNSIDWKTGRPWPPNAFSRGSFSK